MTKVLSIDIGGSKLMTALGEVGADTDSRNTWKPLAMAHRPFGNKFNADDVWRTIRETLDELDVMRSQTHKYVAVGINVPGLADPKCGMWVYAPFSGIADFPIAKMVADLLHVPVFIENDVNACALGEKYFGACRMTNHFLWITISNGIGGGLVLDGKVFSGAQGNAGEIGHFCVEENEQLAIPCGCGNRGCLEAQAAGPGIAKRYKQLTGQTHTAAEIAVLAQNNDPKAIAIFEKTGYYLGKAIAAACNLINPEKIIIGGGVGRAFTLFYSGLKVTFDCHVFKAANKGICIEPTQLGDNAAVIGAAAVALQGVNTPH